MAWIMCILTSFWRRSETDRKGGGRMIEIAVYIIPSTSNQRNIGNIIIHQNTKMLKNPFFPLPHPRYKNQNCALETRLETPLAIIAPAVVGGAAGIRDRKEIREHVAPRPVLHAGNDVPSSLILHHSGAGEDSGLFRFGLWLCK